MNKHPFNSKGLISLWQSACDGDQECLAKLFSFLQDPIYRYCCAQLGDPNLAIEATQETAVRIMRSLNSFEERSQMTTWAIGFAVNVCREFNRDKSRWPNSYPDDITDQPTTQSPIEHIDTSESFTRLRLFVNDLAPRQREAIVLKYFEEIPMRQVAEIMKISEGTVKATLNQALANLKRIMRFKS